MLSRADGRAAQGRRGARVQESELKGLVEAQLGVAVVRVEPIATGLGLRRFLRLHTSGAPATLVARIEAPEDPAGRPAGVAPEPPLEPLRSFLERGGLPVPARLGGDPARGVDLLEDVGARSLAELAAQASAAERTALYRTVLGWIPALQRLADPGRLAAFERRLDRAQIRYKGELFASWSLPEALGREPRSTERAAAARAFERIADLLEDAPRRLAHRDLQSQNVQARPAGEGPPRLAMIDFQAAWLAPPEYDAVCLLRDSYVELPAAEAEAHLAWLRPRLPDAPDAESFARRFDLLTVARKGKDHARFLYAARERGDRRWLRHLPATARALRGAAPRVARLDPALADLAGWLERLPEAPCAR
jgi:aminoglycoside/choline kinase family phosphotransferase